MPLDANGAWVPELAPPTADQLGVAAAPSIPVAPALPLNPLEADRMGLTDPNSPNSRPVVTSPTQEPPPVVPVAAGAPVQPSQVPPPVPAAATPPVAPVIPIRRTPTAGAAQPPGGGIPGDLASLDKQVEANTEAEKAATTNAGEVEATGKANEAEAISQRADLQRQQAADLAAQQQYVRDRQDELNQIDRQNLEAARNKTIPDFWAGREGAHVGATIGVVLAGLGAGFLGSTQNQAAEVVQHNVDKYFDRKKEEIDNLFKYAQAQGLVNDRARDQYAKTLTDMLQQHAAVLDAAKTRAEAVAAESQSEDAKARAAVLATQLGAAATKEHLAVNDQRVKWYDAQDANKAKLMEGRAALIRANADADKARAEANKVKGEAGAEKEIKPIQAEFDKDEQRLMGNARTKGLIAMQQDVRELGNNLKKAVASGDSQAVVAAAIQAKEKISRLNTGAAPSGHVLEFLNSLEGDPAKAGAKVSKILGNPKESNQMIGGLVKLLDQADEGALQQIDKQREQVVRKYIGPSGIARTPAQRAHVEGRINGLFGTVSTRTAKGEVPRYAEGGTTQTPAQVHPQDSEAVAWAKAHPQDPRATAILKANGI